MGDAGAQGLMRRLAAIDIGTNTVLLLVAATDGVRLEPLHFEQRIPRLGKGVDATGTLHPDSMDRVVKALLEYKPMVEALNPDGVVVTATSAVRDAANRDAFMRRVQDATGWPVTLISGADEASITWAGALAVLDPVVRPSACSVIDIGGGSTELITGTNQGPEDGHSFDMGAVRFTERYFSGGYAGTAVTSARQAAEKLLQTFDFSRFSDRPLLGVAGTVTSLAYMDAGLSGPFDPDRINGQLLTTERVDAWLERSLQWGTGGLEAAFPVVMKGRADIFPAGLLILSCAMHHLRATQITVSCGGIREGAVLYRFNGRI